MEWLPASAFLPRPSHLCFFCCFHYSLQQLQREVDRAASAQTAAEFRALVSSLQGQIAALQERLKLGQVRAGRKAQVHPTLV